MSQFLLITGDPELPPIISFVVTKLNGVAKSSLVRPSTYRLGSSNGPLLPKLAERSYSPNKVVIGGAIVPFMAYPFTLP